MPARRKPDPLRPRTIAELARLIGGDDVQGLREAMAVDAAAGGLLNGHRIDVVRYAAWLITEAPRAKKGG